MRDAIKITQVFIRWQRNSCLPCQGIKVPNEEDLFHFNFYQDIAKSTEVRTIFQQIEHIVFRAAEELKRYQEQYRRYKHLFTSQKVCLDNK